MLISSEITGSSVKDLAEISAYTYQLLNSSLSDDEKGLIARTIAETTFNDAGYVKSFIDKWREAYGRFTEE